MSDPALGQQFETAVLAGDWEAAEAIGLRMEAAGRLSDPLNVPLTVPTLTAAPTEADVDTDSPQAAVDPLTAALAYARAGWYVLPVAAGTKDPGSVVGRRWQDQSTRDPERIAAWWAGTSHGVALHAGRSGAVIFDIDVPRNVPKVLSDALRAHSCPIHLTRVGDNYRGHYLFAQPPGRLLGNSVGTLSGGWGEVRGANGVIVVYPSRHPEDTGWYRWTRVGAVPVLPGEVADALPEASPAVDAVTPELVRAFTDSFTDDERPELLAALLTAFDRRVSAGESRHDAAVTAAVGAAKEAKVGCYPAQRAIEALRGRFTAAVAVPGESGHARTAGVARSEFDSILAWAIGQAMAADDAEIRQRIATVVPPLRVATLRAVPSTTDEPEHEHEEFWATRPELAHVHAFARARRCSPWAVLGCVLARVVAYTPPDATLPALIGGRASLNLFTALVGPSGSGKSTAMTAAAEAFVWPPQPLAQWPLGSGEGLLASYARRTPKQKGGGGGAIEQHTTAVLFYAPEVDTLTKLSRDRRGSTLADQLRIAWDGGTLGFSYADPDKRLTVSAHHYRLCLVVGVQPAAADWLLVDQASTGGPQRFVWLPTIDPTHPDDRPEEPEPRVWAQPRYREVAVCASARVAIDTAHLARSRGDGDALDGHVLLCRLKVAAALGLLAGQRSRTYTLAVTESDWELAGAVMDLSDRTRSSIVATLDQVRGARDAALGRSIAVREAAGDEEKQARVMRSVLSKIDRIGRPGATRRELARVLHQSVRGYLDAAVDILCATGQLIERDGVYHRP